MSRTLEFAYDNDDRGRRWHDLRPQSAQGLLASAGIDLSLSSDDAGGAYPFDLSGGAQLFVHEKDLEAASELLIRS